MPGQTEAFHEMTDIYQEILQTAQKQADQQLMALLRQRLKSMPAAAYVTRDGCEVLTFPGIEPEFRSESSDVTCFWKQPRFWQDLLQFTIFLACALFLILHYLTLATEAYLR